MADSDFEDFLSAISLLFGYTYLVAWSISFYPQLLLNIERRSTAGVTLSFPFLNISGFAFYSLSNILLFYSPVVRQEYEQRNPKAPEPTVRFNDILFAVHGLVISIITTSQFVKRIWGFRQGGQTIGNSIWGITIGCMVGVLWAISMAVFQVPEWGWLDVVNAMGHCKTVVTVSKYIPQVLSNHRRKSTRGWSIWAILTDVLGSVLSIAQLFIDSYLSGDWSGVTGNLPKFALGQVSLIFDLIFIAQHYVLYAGVEDTELGETSPLLSRPEA